MAGIISKKFYLEQQRRGIHSYKESIIACKRYGYILYMHRSVQKTSILFYNSHRYHFKQYSGTVG